MTLTPDLERLRLAAPDYEPSLETQRRLARKTLIALVGPTAIGKSTLINEVLHIGGDDYSEGYSVVTRTRRPSDPALYRTADEGYSIERVTKMIDNQEVTNYTVHPGGQLYASIPESFPATYNLLPTMPDSLPLLRKAGFAAVHAVYIVTTGKEWGQRLETRRDDPAYAGRIIEAAASLQWGIEHADTLSFVNNESGQLEHSAQNIISIAKGTAQPGSHEEYLKLLHEMLVVAQTELSTLQGKQ